MSKSILAVVLTSLWLFQFIWIDSWTAVQISAVQINANEHQSHAEVIFLSSEQIKQLKLSATDFQFEFNGKYYDIESAFWNNQTCMLTVHEDIEEEELIKELDESKQEKQDANVFTSLDKIFKAFPISENLQLAAFNAIFHPICARFVSKKYRAPSFHFFLPPEELS